MEIHLPLLVFKPYNMNLTDYFNPVDFTGITGGVNPLGKYGLGYAVSKDSESIDQKALSNAHVAIVGVPVNNGKRQKKGACSPDLTRKGLYKLASLGTDLKIIDLGNLKPAKSRKGTLLALRDIVEYLNQLEVLVIVLGGSQDLTTGIAEAFKSKKFLWLTAVDAVLDIKKGREVFNSTNYLTQLFKKLPDLFQFSLIGYQQPYTPEHLLAKTKATGNHLRLGELRDNIQQAELLIRNSDILSFDMGAIKHTEAPGTLFKNPNGLHGEEACQLAYYAGLSSRLSVFGLFEMAAEKDDAITPSLAAEITWYFLQGVLRRKPSSFKTLYKVEVEGVDQPVVFRHDRELDRWWFDVRSVSGEVVEIACSKEEYLQAATNEIPDRWLRFVQKLDSLSK